MALSNTDWDDIPSSSELFGGDFFGDELMEMYTADHGLNLGENSASVITATAAAAAGASSGLGGYDDVNNKHPGILVAMNAAAMDGGLSPLGASLGFVPMSAAPSEVSFPSFLSPPPAEAVVAPAPAPSQQQLPLLSSVAPPPKATVGRAVPLSTAGLGAKRPAASAQGQPKRLKGAGQTSASTARVGKVAGLPRTNSMNAAPKLAKPTLPPMAVPPAGVVRAPATAAVAAIKSQAGVPTLIKSIVHQKDKMPVGGGINHQVLARPSAVPSSASAVSAATAAVTHHRNISPAFSITAAAAAAEGCVLRDGKSPVVATGTASTTGPKSAATEADFKDVASAAVSCLIQNASSTSSLGSMLKPTVKSNEKIDTSTAHITALTSQNWVTACNPTPCPDSPPSSSSAVACDKAARNARRATLSQEDRAKQNRDRNREHARNTRLRKKAYVEELKRTLTEMVSQRDAAELEKRHEAQRNREQREVRFRVMEEFLNLRGRNELNAARWVAILEDGFMFTLPRTPYRRMVDGEKSWSSDVYGNGSSCVEQVLRGAAAVIEDSAHLSTFLQSFGGSMMSSLSSSTSAAAAAAPQVQIVYKCDRKRFFMDGNVTFMDFTANTLGAVARGAPNEVVFKGSMSALFSPASNKLISIDMTFDSGSIAQQIEALGNVVVSSMNDAATTAAHEAGALLDSLQMPQMYVDKTVGSEAGAAGPVSVSSDDGERSTDSSSAAPINS
ncbi:hypothetical protein ACHAWU_001016 [Discostella pseudostelligera]|uniref:BZIP domain-containing protein n=1 Tax=Discostella pseudostelligera TaxID=259834 RepID=A0ABD3MJC8_9STRA